MPPRTNDFQQLIAFIETQLAPAGATVTESAMVEPLDGSAAREVDVLIEASIGTHDISIALECRDHERPQDRTWIDQLVGKYRSLPIDRVIAVSSSGFTPGAEEQARGADITTLALEEALELDWAEAFTRWQMGLIVWYHPLISARIAYCSDDPPDIPGELLKGCTVTNTTGTLNSTFEQDVLDLWKKHAPDAVREWSKDGMQELWSSGEGKEWDVEVPFDAHGKFLVDPSGRKHQIKKVTLTLRCHFEFQRVAPRYFTYNRTHLARGRLEPEGDGYRYDFTLLYNEDGTPRALNVRQTPSTEDTQGGD